MLTKQEKKKKTGEYKIQDKQATRPVYKQKPRLPRSCIKHSLTPLNPEELSNTP